MQVLLRSSFLQEEIDLRRPSENEKAQESKDEEAQNSVITLTALDNRKTFQRDFAEMCIGVNIALEKVSNMTRWSSWLKASQYHCSHLALYASFLKQEMSKSKSEILKSTLETLEDEEKYRNNEVELTFIAEDGKRIIDLIYFFQTKNEPTNSSCGVQQIDGFSKRNYRWPNKRFFEHAN